MINFLLYAKNIDLTARFYDALGVGIVREKHGNGPEHFSFSEGAIVAEIYPETSGQEFVSFLIRIEIQHSVQSVLSALLDVDLDYSYVCGSTISSERYNKQRLKDPDGRIIDIVQYKY
ncbi:MAG: hypothetical protein CMH30_02250 [Micavibrio sp.]|nr:hypothetical protein [Micavibrio sp.]|tara:strand:- start:237 stop:590 length:354 start_codon:yes stop_codon:yes gene_type:complete